MKVILSSKIQLGTVLDSVLKHSGPASLTVSTFSTGEEFLRHLHMLRKKSMIRHAVLYCDIKAAEKTSRLKNMMQECFEEINLCKNHSKIMLVLGEKKKIAVITSQNMTRGNRLESYVICDDQSIIAYLQQKLNEIKTFKNGKTTD